VRDVNVARILLGVALVGATILGVLVCLRYLIFALLYRDGGLAVVASLALVVFGFAGLLLVIGGVL
jgi:hypothetical protein